MDEQTKDDVIGNEVEKLSTAVMEMIETGHPLARSLIALTVLPGATSAVGCEGAKEPVDLAFKIADAFLARVLASVEAHDTQTPKAD